MFIVKIYLSAAVFVMVVFPVQSFPFCKVMRYVASLLQWDFLARSFANYIVVKVYHFSGLNGSILCTSGGDSSLLLLLLMFLYVLLSTVVAAVVDMPALVHF